ncbi:MAG: monovalent cation/H+ antiporter complex subunit F [Bowdeniella nasicola]|nr:monovalent cation/H+ antiporter complex subunit F [Bowdeniella nasicola]
MTDPLLTTANTLQYGAFALLAAAVVIVLIRMGRGPSMLDRALAMDVITAALIGAVATWSALTRRLDLIPALVGLAMVGFIGTTVIARFMVIDNAEEARVLTEQEEAELDAAPIDDDAAPVHDIDGTPEGDRHELD